MISAVSLYFKLFLSSVKDVICGWRFIWAQVFSLFILGVVTFFLSRLGFVGSIFLGIIFSFALSFYLAIIKALVLKEKFIAESIKDEGIELFSPVISCFFCLFLVQIIVSVLKPPIFFVSALGILISVFLNPVLEIIYLEGGTFSEILNRSVNFVKDNFFIWFSPIFVLISPFVISNPRVLLEVFGSDPLNILRNIIEGFSSSLSILTFTMTVPVLYFITIFLVFRGRLFSSIENKSRIKKWW